MANGTKLIEAEIRHVARLIEELKEKKGRGSRVEAQEMDSLSSRLSQLQISLAYINGGSRRRRFPG